MGALVSVLHALQEPHLVGRLVGAHECAKQDQREGLSAHRHEEGGLLAPRRERVCDVPLSVDLERDQVGARKLHEHLREVGSIRVSGSNAGGAPVADKARLTEIDPDILARFETFHRCSDCGKVYWPGSHFDRMQALSRNVASRALLQGLRDPGAYPHPVRSIQVVETHISWVILTGDYAYKLKKPVELGFLDFSTLELRRAYCEEEVRINRRTAPSIYLGVRPVGAVAHGLRIGAEPALDYVVAMRQFPHEARLDRRIGREPFGAAEEEELAHAIAGFHAGLAAVATADDEPERTVRPARNNFRHLDPAGVSDRFEQKLAVIEAWTLQKAESRGDAIRRRAVAGHVRDCHGDLHLENIVRLDGRFVPFDAIEFNPELRRIDTANDIAFLVMDLMARGRQGNAYGVLGAWLERTGDYDSLCVMRFYLVYRAMVRAVVSATRQAQSRRPEADTGQAFDTGRGPSFRPGPERYIALAAELVDTPPPTLILMHGLSGSGKSIALQVLEDVSYYCIDNLPVSLFDNGQVARFSDGYAGQGLLDVRHQVAVGEHHPLGAAGGARGVDDRGQVVGVDVLADVQLAALRRQPVLDQPDAFVVAGEPVRLTTVVQQQHTLQGSLLGRHRRQTPPATGVLNQQQMETFQTHREARQAEWQSRRHGPRGEGRGGERGQRPRGGGR